MQRAHYRGAYVNGLGVGGYILYGGHGHGQNAPDQEVYLICRYCPLSGRNGIGDLSELIGVNSNQFDRALRITDFDSP